MVQRQ